MWNKMYAESENNFNINNINNAYFQYKNKFKSKKTLKYKNRFLAKTWQLNEKVSNFYVFKGYKLKYLKLFNYANLLLFNKINGIQTPKNHYKKYQFNDFLIENTEYIKLLKIIAQTPILIDLNLLIPLFVEKESPMVKPTILVKKKLKKKKTLKKYKNKYSIQYKYIPQNERFAIVLKWYSMFIKFSEKSLIQSYLTTTLNIINNENNSPLTALKNQVYAGLAAEQE